MVTSHQNRLVTTGWESIVVWFNWLIDHILTVWHQYFCPVATHLAFVTLGACAAQRNAIAVQLPQGRLTATAVTHTLVVDSHYPCSWWNTRGDYPRTTTIIIRTQHTYKWFCATTEIKYALVWTNVFGWMNLVFMVVFVWFILIGC